MRVRRPSPATQRVLKVFLDDPTQPRHGFDIAKDANIATSRLYPILAHLEHELGWLASNWEDIDGAAQGRPRRRYCLTSDGAAAARQALQEASRRAAARAPEGGPE